jgi:hypothetical protein
MTSRSHILPLPRPRRPKPCPIPQSPTRRLQNWMLAQQHSPTALQVRRLLRRQQQALSQKPRTLLQNSSGISRRLAATIH